MGVSLDGFVASADGRPSLLSMSDFVPGQSHGYPEFIVNCDAVVMGRATFDPALQAPNSPWSGLRVYVLTSRPLPTDLPTEVVSASSANELLELMRARGSDRDVHLVGGPQTIQAFREIGALDRLEVVVLPVLLATVCRSRHQARAHYGWRSTHNARSRTARPSWPIRSPRSPPTQLIATRRRIGCQTQPQAP